MKCEFCHKGNAKYRCTSCGTYLCQKHGGAKVGLFGGIVLTVITGGGFLLIWPFLISGSAPKCLKCNSKSSLTRL